MLALKMQPGTLASQQVVVNGELTYHLLLSWRRFGRQPLQLKITATTLTGTIVVQQQQFSDLKVARATFDAYLTDLVQK